MYAFAWVQRRRIVWVLEVLDCGMGRIGWIQKVGKRRGKGERVGKSEREEKRARGGRERERREKKIKG